VTNRKIGRERETEGQIKRERDRETDRQNKRKRERLK
jgi:hypothetical protein